MSLQTTAAMRWAPSAAPGASVTPNAAEWANSSWVEVLAAAGANSLLLAVAVEPGSVTGDPMCEIDVGVGAAGSEAVIGTLRFVLTDTPGPRCVHFGVPIDAIPSGSRVAVRLRKSGTNTTEWTVAVGYQHGAGGSDHSTTYPQRALPAGATGAGVARVAGAWDDTNWYEFSGALSTAIVVSGIAVGGSVTATDVEYDLGTGSAGSESVIATVAVREGGASGQQYIRLHPPVGPIVSGTRLAIRRRDSGGSTATVYPAITYYEYEDPNVAPVANAGPDQTVGIVPGATMAGSGTDDGKPDPPATLTYLWSQVSGSGTATFTDATDPLTTVSFDVVGCYTLRLTVDDSALSNADDMVVTVIPYDCPGVLPGPTLCGPDPVLTWIEETQYVPGSPDTLVRVVSDIALPDPSTYYHGKKAPRVLDFGPITRRLSDVQGQWQGATMRWREAEVDRVLRGRLAVADTRALTRTDVVCRMIRESDWVLKLDARTMFIGHVTRVAPFGEDLSTELEAGDQLARAIDAQEITCPRRLLSPLYFPGLPVAQIGVPEPILYGTLSGALSAVTPPVLTGDPARGAFVDGGVQVWGYGDLADPPSAPTGVTLTEMAGAGSIVTGEAPGDTYYAFVTTVDANGNESDPSTFAQLDAGSVPSVTVVAAGSPGSAIKVEWDAPGSPAPAFHRVYLGWNYYGVVVVQMLQVSGAAVEATFDDSPTWTEVSLDDYTRLATGAVRSPYTWFGYYAVSAIDAAGEETALSAVGTAFARGYRRPIHVEWDEVPGATAYRVYRKPHPGAAYDRRWEVVVAGSPPAGSPPVYSFDDDLLDTGVTYIADAPAARGLVPVIYTGQETLTATGETWYRFLVASHAVAGIDEWYLDGVLEDAGTAGVDYLIPGWPGWTDRFGTPVYRDFNGRRYTVIYARGPKGDALAGFGGSPVTAGAATSTLALNVRGIESSAAADGTGTLITDLHEQFLHWMINFGPLGDYQSGTWLPAPTWSPIADHCQIDTDSFRARATEAATFVAGGYVGGGQLREALSLRDWIARWCLSTDTRIGISASGQWRLTRQVPEPSTAVARTYTDVRHVQVGSLTIEPVDEEHWNALPYNYRDDPVAGAWEVADGLLVDAASVALYGATRVGPSQDLYFVRASAVAADILTRVLARHADPPLRVTFETIDLCGTLTELGDVIGLSSLAGTDVDAWTSMPLFVDGVVVHPTSQRTAIETRALVAPHLAGA